MELVQPVQLNIYHGNICRKDLGWIHFDNEPRVQEKHLVWDQWSYATISKQYPIYSSINSVWQQYSIQGGTVDLQRERATLEERNFVELIKVNQGQLSNRENAGALIQFTTERQSQHLKI